MAKSKYLTITIVKVLTGIFSFQTKHRNSSFISYFTAIIEKLSFDPVEIKNLAESVP